MIKPLKQLADTPGGEGDRSIGCAAVQIQSVAGTVKRKSTGANHAVHVGVTLIALDRPEDALAAAHPAVFGRLEIE